VQADPEQQRAAVAPAEQTVETKPAGPSAAHLTVRVLGKTSRGPVALVRVTLTPLPEGGNHSYKNTKGANGDLENWPITGADGIVRFELPPAREFSLRLQNEDERFRPGGRKIPDSTSVSGNYSFRIERPVAIRVIGQATRSDDTSVLVTRLLAGEERELVLEIEDGLDGHVVGQVVCAQTREPVAGARVRLLTGGQVRTEWHTPGPDEQTTGSDGRFELAFALRSDPILCVEAAGYGLRYANLDAVHADLAHALIINVSRAATLIARVLDASGAPIPEARVELGTKGYMLSHSEADEQGFSAIGFFTFPPDESWRAATGADGRAKLEGLPPRVEIGIRVEANGRTLQHDPVGLNLQPGEVKELEWRVGSGTSVRGLVLDQDGKPVSGIEIWAAKAVAGGRRSFLRYERERVASHATTDLEGRYALMDLLPGTWSIGPGADRDTQVVGLAEIIELTGEPALELNLHVFRGLYIRGRVLTPTGEPASRSRVTGRGETGEFYEGINADPDGKFALGPVTLNSVTLTANAINKFAASDPVQATAGDTGIVLQLKLGGVIRGRVIYGVAGSACAAQLFFAPEKRGSGNGMFSSGMQTSTQENGTFSRGGFDAGIWSLSAMTADGRFAQQAHIEVGGGSDSGELVLALSPGGKLRLGYKGAEPQLRVTITAQGAAVNFSTGIEPGKFTDCLAPAGALVLEIRKAYDGPARTKAVDLKPGETKEITLTDED